MNYLKTLASLEAPSGCESNVFDTLSQMLSELTDSVKLSTLGSTVGYISCGKPNAKKLMLSAHIDSVSAFVTQLLEGGFIKIAVNGMDRRVMLNSDFTVLGKNGKVRAIPCVLPPHLQKESGKVPEDSELTLDTGLSLEALESLVSVGDTVIFTPNYGELLGNRIVCASADNRASCAVVLHTLEMIKNKDIAFDIIAAFTAQEEAGASGAATVAFEEAPDEAIILDVTFAQTPDTHYPEAGKLGGGTMIGVSPILSRRVIDSLRAAADRIDEKWQWEVMPRSTGTDADEVAKTGKGVACGMLSVPLRYMHTSSEVIDNADILSTARVLAEYIIRG